MGDDDQRARPAVEIVLDHRQRVDVEVVGRLVEQQHVRLVEQQPQELQPTALAAGQIVQRRGELVPGEPEVLEQRRRTDLMAAGQLRATRRLSSTASSTRSPPVISPSPWLRTADP